MALLAELFVNLTARTEKFEKGMKKGQKSLTGFEKAAKSTQKTMQLMKTAFVGLGTFLAGSAIVRDLRKIAETIDELGKTSQRLGLTTEALAGLRHAANQTGVETNTLDMALQRMVRRVAQAASGTGEAQEALERLGISARKLTELEADQQFAAIADAMKNVKGQSEKVAIAFKLFDSEGVKLVNTLDLGSKGLTAMQIEAEKLGLAVSGEEAERMAKFNDELDRLSKLIGGFKQNLVIDISQPAVESIEGLRLLIADIKAVTGYSGRLSSLPNELFKQTPSGRAVEALIGGGTNAVFSRAGTTFRSGPIQEHERMGLPADHPVRAERLGPLTQSVLGDISAFAPQPQMRPMARDGRGLFPVPTSAEQRQRELEMIELLRRQSERAEESAATLRAINEELRSRGVEIN